MRPYKIHKPTHLLLSYDGQTFGYIQTRGRALCSMAVNLIDGRKATTASTSCAYDMTGYFKGRKTTPYAPLDYLFGPQDWPDLSVVPV